MGFTEEKKKEILLSKEDDKELKASRVTNFRDLKNTLSLRPTVMSYMFVTNVRAIAFGYMQM